MLHFFCKKLLSFKKNPFLTKRILLSRGVPMLGSNTGRIRLQHHFQQLPPHQANPHGGQQQQGTHLRGAKTLYHHSGAPKRHFSHNSYEVSPSSFRYYSSSVEYLAGTGSQNTKHHFLSLFFCHFFFFTFLHALSSPGLEMPRLPTSRFCYFCMVFCLIFMCVFFVFLKL